MEDKPYACQKPNMRFWTVIRPSDLTIISLPQLILPFIEDGRTEVDLSPPDQNLSIWSNPSGQTSRSIVPHT
ncbi:MAG: hypothetical protein QXT39_04975, partial [Conexivisphaerales archaeon]